MWQPENSIKSHMVSYCSVIKPVFKLVQSTGEGISFQEDICNLYFVIYTVLYPTVANVHIIILTVSTWCLYSKIYMSMCNFMKYCTYMLVFTKVQLACIHCTTYNALLVYIYPFNLNPHTSRKLNVFTVWKLCKFMQMCLVSGGIGLMKQD